MFRCALAFATIIALTVNAASRPEPPFTTPPQQEADLPKKSAKSAS